jgi:hypothetical protein
MYAGEGDRHTAKAGSTAGRNACTQAAIPLSPGELKDF